MYAWSEHFVLPISHDEVVHGKGSLLDKMPGDEWQKRANYRWFRAYMTAHPGKKLLFMGSEFGQWREWRDEHSLDWHLLEDPEHRGLQALNRDLNRLYATLPALHAGDSDPAGFALDRPAQRRPERLRVPAPRPARPARRRRWSASFNATPVPRDDYWLGVPEAGEYRKLLDTDAVAYGGSGYLAADRLATPTRTTVHGYPFRLRALAAAAVGRVAAPGALTVDTGR